ncbi:hypothetical protein GCM10008018_26790 [Paenibacillus marchantiophytorum]|uniref:Uncharacterized protein n=1 Tax=Paenibacillus marchantiophytorum TaxID=1619310 RepID=A0ABQ1ENG1_9BACL|nr:hypothetical protein GCM10008018_26790 [Paenibacillus marchantiophytorum]
MLAKQPEEIIHVGDADFGADFPQGKVGVLQQISRLLDANSIHILERR